MRLLLFTLEYPPFCGGVANYYKNLVKYWPVADRVFVLNNNNGRLINKNWPFLKWLPAIQQLSRAVKNLKIEHIIIGHILPLGLVGWIFNRLHGMKYTVILHGMDFSYATKVWRKKIISKIILTGAEKIICTNQYTAELVKKFLAADDFTDKIFTVNPGVENFPAHNAQFVNRLKTKYNLSDKLILLSVGRLVKRKGFDKVIASLPDILKLIPNLVYVILGGGQELNDYQSLVANYNLKNNIIIIDQAADEERNSWYEICDIFIMPSRNINGDFEGFGIVYLEANLTGKPVIAGRSGGVGDAVIDALNGLMVNPENIREISAAVIKLINNSELRKKLGEQGRRRAINEFNWQKQANKIYRIISNDNASTKLI